MDDTIDVKFGASTDGLASGIKQASSTVASGVAEMSKGLLGLGTVVKGLAGLFAGLAGGLAGGALFKQAIEESVNFGREVGNLSRQFNLTAGEASKLALAIDDAFLSTEEYQAIAMRLTRQLKSNEDGLNSMGIATRDSKKQLLDQNQLMFSALDGLRKYRAGTDQLAAAQVALGRGISEEVLQKLFDVQDAYAATKDKADEFGRVMGVENVQASMDYRRALDNVGDSFQGIRLVIGNALLPVWNNLMELFSSAVGSTIPALNGVFKVLGVSIAFLTQLTYGLFQVFKSLFMNVGQFVGGITAFLVNLAEGNWGGAKAAWSAMTDDMKGTWNEASDNIEERTRKLQKAMSDIWNGPDASAGKKVESGDGRSGGKSFVDPGASGKMLEEFKRQLALLKLAEGDYKEYSKEAEVEFWRTKLNLFARGSKEWQEANALYLTARRAAAKETVDIAKAEYDMQVTQAGNNEDQKVKLAEAWLNKMRTLYGADSQQYRAALKDKLNADMAYEAQRKQLIDIRAKALLDARTSELDLTLEMINARVDMGWMEKDEAVRVQREIIMAKHQLQLDDLQRRAELYKEDVVQQEQIAAERLRLESELQAKLQGLAVTQQRTVFDTWSGMVSGLASTMEGVLYGLITKTMTWRGAMQAIVGSVLQMFIKMGVDKVKAWVLSETMMTAATKAWTAIRTALGIGGNAATVAAKGAESAAVITLNAGEAASGAAASQAAIPVVGPVLAAAAAVAMLALVLGFKGGGGGGSSGTSAPPSNTYSIPSAAGGWWQVPGNLMAKIHEDEMVMPAPLAQGVRDMVESGGMGGGTVHIHATDADSVRNLFKRHADDLWDVMRGKAKGNPRF